MTPNQKILNQLQKTTEVLEVATYGDGQSVTFKEQGLTFVVMLNGDKGFTAYQAYRDGVDLKFLPTCKEGTTIKALDNFIASRIK